MLGRDPFDSPGSVPTTFVPLVIVTSMASVSFNPKSRMVTTRPGITAFDPSMADTACLAAPNNVPTKLVQASSILNPATLDFGGTIVGRTQYTDAFQRGNFWKVLGFDRNLYHALLGPVRFLGPLVIHFPPRVRGSPWRRLHSVLPVSVLRRG